MADEEKPPKAMTPEAHQWAAKRALKNSAVEAEYGAEFEAPRQRLAETQDRAINRGKIPPDEQPFVSLVLKKHPTQQIPLEGVPSELHRQLLQSPELRKRLYDRGILSTGYLEQLERATMSPRPGGPTPTED